MRTAHPVDEWNRLGSGQVATSGIELRVVEHGEGAGHWIQQQRPEEVDAALLEFARGLG
ncbi:hypothetical protein ACFV4K_12330 [Nocardia sp. NPDC059764]|uniref:hypothetical protein n=1 Tax=Nocardia sp. NPDC059764 TaxID=3346939 RepID=UPI00364E787A